MYLLPRHFELRQSRAEPMDLDRPLGRRHHRDILWNCCPSNTDRRSRCCILKGTRRYFNHTLLLLKLDKQIGVTIYQPNLAANEACHMEGVGATLDGVGHSTHAYFHH